MARILCLLPDRDFDPGEAAIPWAALSEAGHAVSFATQSGRAAACDPVTLTGNGLPWIARSLRARPEARALYAAMAAAPAFAAPGRWDDAGPGRYDALLLPGGHAPGMKPYLESPRVAAIAAAFFARAAPVAAICHGVIVLARARRPDGRSLLYGKRTTALTARMEGLSIALTRHALGSHYRTYPASVEAEVTAALADQRDFDAGPLLPRYATRARPDAGFVVEDGQHISARWPGDAWTLARRLIARLG